MTTHALQLNREPVSQIPGKCGGLSCVSPAQAKKDLGCDLLPKKLGSSGSIDSEVQATKFSGPLSQVCQGKCDKWPGPNWHQGRGPKGTPPMALTPRNKQHHPNPFPLYIGAGCGAENWGRPAKRGAETIADCLRGRCSG